MKRDNRRLSDLSDNHTTKYGEFIASFDRWILPEKQREIAEKLQKPIGRH